MYDRQAIEFGLAQGKSHRQIAKEIGRQQSDVSREVKVWPVPREVAIREFVEDKIGPGQYVLGSAFYQLTKDELIEADKDLMIVEKGKKVVYAGPSVRNLLKLPLTDVKVRPGNHGNWDLYVQSRSVNRKLVRGTKLIYRI